MAQKCVRQGCGKEYTDPDEKCQYHPGPPIFHEGQKGWKCCKPRVLTFDEFMEIPPCTTGTHSTTEKPPPVEEKPQIDEAALAKKIAEASVSAPTRLPIQPAQHIPTPPPPPPDSEDDDPSLEIPDGAECRRKACGAKYKKGSAREGEECVHHPGVPIFHEGSKGYSCCKRRVLEFDQFMKIEGCKTKEKHLFVGSGKKDKAESGNEEILTTVRHDFYQTPTQVIASYFLKKIKKEIAKVDFKSKEIDLDLMTSDPTPKRYTATVPLFGEIDSEKSSFKVLGTKLELILVKADGASWPVLRSDEQLTADLVSKFSFSMTLLFAQSTLCRGLIIGPLIRHPIAECHQIQNYTFLMTEVSHGRGGAGNFDTDDTKYVDGEVVRTGIVGSHGDGAFSSGRGGAGNIADIGTTSTHRNDTDVVPEAAVRASQDTQGFHTGRGGAGNEHHAHEQTEVKPRPVAPVGLADKLKTKLFGAFKH
ncbi:zinc-binding [Trichoderma arundinaceum]|uniref:Zinc-binding n=1 Tax=Trichoderma arundinaceum TaxID=490622 RepID=A0A395NLM9_TRIAR|nr:zinc-binding [Trichoderma arundinaceum]